MRLEGKIPETTTIPVDELSHDLELVVTFTLQGFDPARAGRNLDTKIQFIQSLINPGYAGTTFTVDRATLRPRRTP